jgi:hypothetical protein
MPYFYENFLEVIRERMGVYETSVCSGSLEPEKYKFIAGKLQGLLECERLARELYKRMVEGKAAISSGLDIVTTGE